MKPSIAPASDAKEAVVEAHLDTILDALPEGLVCQPERRNLRLAAKPFSLLPGEAVVELHLGGLTQRDFTVRLWPIGAQKVLAEVQRGRSSLPPSTQRFLARWLGSDGSLARVPYVELEQDIINGEAYQWVGPAIRPDFRFGGGVPATKEEVVETGLAVLRALPDWPLPFKLIEQFRKFVDQLPASARLNMMSSLGARAYRPRAGLRMILSAPSDVALHMATLNQKAQSQVERLLLRYAGPSIGFDLELSVDGNADYFAFYRRFSNPSWSDADFRVFLDNAVGDALLTHRELQGFRGLASAMYRRHLVLTFKVVLRDTGPARLKAYLERLVY